MPEPPGFLRYSKHFLCGAIAGFVVQVTPMSRAVCPPRQPAKAPYAAVQRTPRLCDAHHDALSRGCAHHDAHRSGVPRRSPPFRSTRSRSVYSPSRCPAPPSKRRACCWRRAGRFGSTGASGSSASSCRSTEPCSTRSSSLSGACSGCKTKTRDESRTAREVHVESFGGRWSMGWQRAHTRTHSRCRTCRARAPRDVRWSRASARVLSDMSVWGGSPIGGPAEATLREGGVSAESAERRRGTSIVKFVICVRPYNRYATLRAFPRAPRDAC